MNNRVNNVLVIGNDPGAALAIGEALAQSDQNRPAMTWVRSLSAGVARLGGGGIDVILLDPDLPDSHGIDTFDEVMLAARRIPILVLTSESDEETGRLAVRRGAKDRVFKEHVKRDSFQLALRHILERAAVEDVLFAEQERAQVTLDCIGDGVISSDNNGKVTYINPVAERMTGWSRSEALGRVLSDVFRTLDGHTPKPVSNPTELAVRRIIGLPRHHVLIRRDGFECAIEDSVAPIRDKEGLVIGAVTVLHDASEARLREQSLSHLAHHDSLTGLPNRTLLHDRLSQAIASARRHGTHVAVLFIDLDHFKRINDSLGHAIGDTLLQGVGRRLAMAVRASDTVSRQGGDEFVVVLSEVEHARHVARQAQKILATLSTRHRIARHDVRVTVSIGISLFPDDGQDAETLIQCADNAMYDVKATGRNNYRFSKAEMNTGAVERQSFEPHLRLALQPPDSALLQARQSFASDARDPEGAAVDIPSSVSVVSGR
jgi:diguanylate cyclase (GGDEF)-like protein/PAS domain S-box-containing protein